MLRKGYIDLWRPLRSEFSKRYFVLYQNSDENESRLDWFENESDYLQFPKIRKSIFVEDIVSINKRPNVKDLLKDTNGANFKYFIVIKCKDNRDYLLSFESQLAFNAWIQDLNTLMVINESKTKPVYSDLLVLNESQTPLSGYHDEFSCHIESTTSAIKNGMVGQAVLRVYPEGINAICEDGKRSVVWQYRYLRRFGASENSFTVEGGHLSGIGEGLYIFRQCQGNDISNLVRSYTNTASKALPTLPPNQTSERNPTTLSLTPDLLQKLPGQDTDKANKLANSAAEPHIYNNDEIVLKKDKTKSRKDAKKTEPAAKAKPASSGKLSSVLNAISKNKSSKANSSKAGGVPVYEYNSLDVCMDKKAPKDKGKAANESHLYGMHLMQQQVAAEEVNEYAEINEVIKKK